jgi:hypothetical protein
VRDKVYKFRMTYCLTTESLTGEIRPVTQVWIPYLYRAPDSMYVPTLYRRRGGGLQGKEGQRQIKANGKDKKSSCLRGCTGGGGWGPDKSGIKEY